MVENKLADDIWKEAVKYFVDLHKTSITFSSASLGAFTALFATLEVKGAVQIEIQFRIIVVLCFICSIMISMLVSIRCVSVMADGRDPSDSMVLRVATYFAFLSAAAGISCGSLAYIMK